MATTYETAGRSKRIDGATNRACFAGINAVAPGAYCPAAEEDFCKSNDKRDVVAVGTPAVKWRPLTAEQVEAVGFEAAYKHSKLNPAKAWLHA